MSANNPQSAQFLVASEAASQEYSEAIYFYSAQVQPYGCFSNFSPHGFQLAGKWWATSEHYFQAQKFIGSPSAVAYAERIRLAKTPKQAATLGRSRAVRLRPDWERVKDDLMYQAVQRKFEAHPALAALLLATDERKIIETAPQDYYWGCGADGSGQNKLGLILMQLRASLRSTSK